MPYAVIKTKTLQSTLITENYLLPRDLYNLVICDASNKSITVTFPDLASFSNLFETTLYNNNPAHAVTAVYGTASDSVAPLTTKKYIVVNGSLLSIGSSGSGDDPAGYLKLDGTNTMTAAFNMGGSNKIINVGNPTAIQDAATKGYLDTNIGGLGVLYLKLDGTNAMSGALNMGNNKIVGVADPVAAQDATNKTYVDSATATLVSAITAASLKLDGTNAMAGALNMGNNRIVGVADPAAAQDGATKVYVDQQVSKYVKLDGTAPMTAPLNMDSNGIVGVADPLAAQDAATKIYVDNAIVALSTAFLKIDGTLPMTAALNANNNRIINVANPTSAQDVANKGYVDSISATYSQHCIIPRFNFVGLPSALSYTSLDNYVISSSIESTPSLPNIWNASSSTNNIVFNISANNPLIITMTPPRPTSFYAVGFQCGGSFGPTSFNATSGSTTLINQSNIVLGSYREFTTTSSAPFPNIVLTFQYAPNASGASIFRSLCVFPRNTSG
jgi:hypothetical protein